MSAIRAGKKLKKGKKNKPSSGGGKGGHGGHGRAAAEPMDMNAQLAMALSGGFKFKNKRKKGGSSGPKSGEQVRSSVIKDIKSAPRAGFKKPQNITPAKKWTAPAQPTVASLKKELADQRRDFEGQLERLRSENETLQRNARSPAKTAPAKAAPARSRSSSSSVDTKKIKELTSEIATLKKDHKRDIRMLESQISTLERRISDETETHSDSIEALQAENIRLTRLVERKEAELEAITKKLQALDAKEGNRLKKQQDEAKRKEAAARKKALDDEKKQLEAARKQAAEERQAAEEEKKRQRQAAAQRKADETAARLQRQRELAEKRKQADAETKKKNDEARASRSFEHYTS
jgi:hypothetical protein